MTAAATAPQQPRTIDWTELRALHVKGVSLKDLSERFNVPYVTVRSRSSREKWCNTVAHAREMVTQDATGKLTASATSWIGKVDAFVHKSLDAMLRRDADSLSCKDLASLMSAAAQCATVARANYGLDATNNARPSVTVNVGVLGSAQGAAWQDQVLDVETLKSVASVEQSTSDASDASSASASPETPGAPMPLP